MTTFASGKFALAISDRSGMAFPYNEMVREWTGAFVHVSEYEPKQPQLDPKPTSADPQALQRARPARTEFPTEDFLPDNPFTTTSSSTTVSVAFENGAMQLNDIVRFRDVKSPVGGVAINTLQLSGGLITGGDITSTATTIKLLLPVGTNLPTSGYIVIEKVNSTSGQFENEVVQYTGIDTSGIGTDLTGCVRGTSAQYRGVAPRKTTASSHSSGAKVFGAYKITALNTRTQNSAGVPATTTIQTGFDFELKSNATSTATGGGFQCTIGPINDRG
jgi:hypothetical protein